MEKKELENLLNVREITPENLEEIKKIISTFGFCYLNFGKHKVPVTSIDDKGKIRRIKYLPPKIYFILRFMRLIK